VCGHKTYRYYPPAVCCTRRCLAAAGRRCIRSHVVLLSATQCDAYRSRKGACELADNDVKTERIQNVSPTPSSLVWCTSDEVHADLPLPRLLAVGSGSFYHESIKYVAAFAEARMQHSSTAARWDRTLPDLSDLSLSVWFIRSCRPWRGAGLGERIPRFCRRRVYTTWANHKPFARSSFGTDFALAASGVHVYQHPYQIFLMISMQQRCQQNSPNAMRG
jgi:hypothetical protein